LLAEGAAQLQAAGIDTARLEARWLLGHVAGLQTSDIIVLGRDIVPTQDCEAFRAVIARRVAHVPIQHILGTTEFYGLEFLCDARALIPRPDSECVVEEALKRIPADRPVLVADLGTGSGCLLAALLANRPHAQGRGVEANLAAASLARENLAKLGLSDRADIFEGSWANWQGWGEADLIISNPPYIASAEIDSLMPEVHAHDPMDALDGGPDGLVAYRQIISLAAAHMKCGAWLVFEIGHDQREAVSTLLQEAGFAAIDSSKDLGGNDRAVWAQLPKL
tara:strand:+ start:12185 stop:13021 length:837 start_codon:yes stop_codon:yes gene_type:complete